MSVTHNDLADENEIMFARAIGVRIVLLGAWPVSAGKVVPASWNADFIAQAGRLGDQTSAAPARAAIMRRMARSRA
jgi:hypothetical protein